MTELKKCPFCGGEARKNAQEVKKGYRFLYVDCKRCGATGPIIRTIKPRVKDEDNQSITDWNRRAE